MEKIASQCKALDSLTDGGLATGTITQIFGEKALGKSIISLQTAFFTIASGNSVIILDTEQSYFSYLVPYWKDRLSKRVGKNVPVIEAKLEKIPKSTRKKQVSRSQLITALSSTLNELGILYAENQLSAVADILSPEFSMQLEVKEPSVILLQIPDVLGLLALHGIDACIEVSSGGRVELRLRQTPVYRSILHQIIRETNAKLLVYDSISAPFKASFPSTQDLPARSAGLAMLLSHAQRLCVEFGIAVFAASHVSIDPIQAWNRRPYGGVILGHEAKFSLELTRGHAKRNESAIPINPENKSEDGRIIWVQRHPALAEYSRYGYLRIDEEGVH
jgi:RecA/RadA recombinase